MRSGVGSMSSIEKGELPEGALLSRYLDSGDYTDCYSTHVPGEVSHAEYVEAFYTTLPFKTERIILKWAVARPSTDEDARELAAGRAEKFAAWYVEERQEQQILLSDYRGKTRSWLMSTPSTHDGAPATTLYFGSAVLRDQETTTNERRMGRGFSLLLGFHKLYSRVLLSSARSRLIGARNGS